MKRILCAAVVAALASSAVFSDQKSDEKAFREAYKSYQTAVAAGNSWQALGYAKEAYEYGELVFGLDHKNTAALLLNYGRLLRDKEEARKILQKAVERHEALYGADSAEMIDPLMDLAANSADLGTLGDARKIYRRVLKLAETHFPDSSLMLGIIRVEMGKIALHEAQSTEALRLLNKARDALEKADAERAAPYLAETEFYIGQYQLARKRHKKATKHLLASLNIYEELAPNSSNTMTNHAFLIEAYEKMGLREEATKHCRAIGAKSPQKPDQDYDPVYQVRPTYPMSAQRSGKEGFAIVEITVDKDGFVQSPTVIEVDGHDAFAQASLDAVAKFRYAPRYENGEAVDTEGVRYRFVYSLR